MTAVVVLDFLPDADALLEGRLGRGWRPLPSDSQDGGRILGHASRLFDKGGESS